MGKLIDTVSGIRLSSVVPGCLTDDNTIHELQNIDLAMKLHYINCVYLFEPTINDKINVLDESKELSISQLKLPMFSLLDAYKHVSGRMRGGENERPYIKCNDCGVRIVEARSSRTVEEVIQMDDQSVFDDFVYKMVLGPDLGFSPLVIFQFTWLKCGGFSIGLRWAHVLGDAFSASGFVNQWARLFSHNSLAPISIPSPIHDKAQSVPPPTKQLRFAKRVDPVGNKWVVNSNLKFKTHTFRVGAKQLSQMRSNECGYGAEFPPFEILSAILWKSVAKLRGNAQPSCVTLCRSNTDSKAYQALSNSQLISTIETNVSISEAKVEDLVKLISTAKADEKELIKQENWVSDFLVYGANLTFVDLREMRLYDMKLKEGRKPVLALCSVDGVGEEGLVLVAPDDDDDGDGRIVTVTFDEVELAELKTELQQTWGIA